MAELKRLLLAGCPISRTDGYREAVFVAFEGLLVLDGKDKDGHEVFEDESGDEEEADEEGQQAKVGGDDEDDVEILLHGVGEKRGLEVGGGDDEEEEEGQEEDEDEKGPKPKAKKVAEEDE